MASSMCWRRKLIAPKIRWFLEAKGHGVVANRRAHGERRVDAVVVQQVVLEGDLGLDLRGPEAAMKTLGRRPSNALRISEAVPGPRRHRPAHSEGAGYRRARNSCLAEPAGEPADGDDAGLRVFLGQIATTPSRPVVPSP